MANIIEVTKVDAEPQPDGRINPAHWRVVVWVGPTILKGYPMSIRREATMRSLVTKLTKRYPAFTLVEGK